EFHHLRGVDTLLGTDPAATDKPSPHGATEPRITTEPEVLVTSVQLCEPTTTAMKEKAVVSDFVDGSSAHCNMAEGELVEDLGLYKTEG
ncbi:hypothetical protein M9458_014258, partial [Cirrhinus mrigala]